MRACAWKKICLCVCCGRKVCLVSGRAEVDGCGAAAIASNGMSTGQLANKFRDFKGTFLLKPVLGGLAEVAHYTKAIC
eukprot:1150607-Pelagomonas_calceolata.AAC.4